jgi:hypothetical protein
MAQELVAKSRHVVGHDEDVELESSATEGAFHGAIEAFGALYAALTGFAIGKLETLSDRRAEARAARLRQRAPERPRRLRDRARRLRS